MALQMLVKRTQFKVSHNLPRFYLFVGDIYCMYSFLGHPTDPGIIPRTLYSLFTNIRPDTGAVYIPHMAKNFSRLSSEQSQEELNFTAEILRSHVVSYILLKYEFSCIIFF